MEVNKIPKVKSIHPVLGCAKAYHEDSIAFLLDCVEKYGNTFEVRMAHKKVVVFNEPKFVQHVLQKNQRNYRRHYAYDVLKLLFRDGIITVDGDVWKRKRRLLQPYFHKKSIQSYFDKIDSDAQRIVQSWTGKDHIDLLEEMGKLTLDIISGCVLGGSIREKSAIVQDDLPFAMGVLIERILNPLQPPMWMPTKKHKKFRKCRENLGNLVNEIIKEKEGDLTGNDLITMYLLLGKKGEDITPEEIFDEVMSVLSAGHESTAIALFVLICNVLENEDIKQKIINEYDSVTNGEPLSYEHLGQLEYVNKVIKEANRLSTPAWSVGRAAIEDDEIEGYKIKKGTSIIISPYLMHRRADLWPNPNKFDPERFNTKPEHQYSYIPFGGGPKLCVGLGLADLEMQIILYHIVKSGCKIHPKEPSISEVPFDTMSLTLRPSNDIKIVPSKEAYNVPFKVSKPNKQVKEEIKEGSCPFH